MREEEETEKHRERKVGERCGQDVVKSVRRLLVVQGWGPQKCRSVRRLLFDQAHVLEVRCGKLCMRSWIGAMKVGQTTSFSG